MTSAEHGWNRVLVTGGCGFIGSHLVRRLASHAAAVRVLDDGSTGNPDNLAGIDCEIVRGSITDPKTIAAAVTGVETVFHLAALPSVSRSIENPIRTHEVNATGTLHVLDACRRLGVRRVVLSSSSSVYGKAATYPTPEDLPLAPRSPYAASKAAAEAYARAYREAFGLSTAVLRYFNVFGPRQDPASEYAAVIPKFIVQMLRGETLDIHGDGSQARDFTFVDNVVDANLLAAGAETLPSLTYNVACGASTTLLELVERLEEIVGVRAERRHTESRPGDIHRSWAAIDRARAELGYAPRIDLDDALRATVDYYRARTPA